MANFQAFEEYQMMNKKSQAFYRYHSFSKFFNFWKSYCMNEKGQKKIEQEMIELADLKLKMKSFKVLKVNF